MNSTSNPVIATVAEASGELIAFEPLSALPTPAPTMVDERAKEQMPIDMVLHCPACGLQHIDAPEDAECDGEVAQTQGWSNPPHKSHLCHGCGHIWRPADVPTNGVQAVKTTGKADSAIYTRPTLQSLGGDAGVSSASATLERERAEFIAWLGRSHAYDEMSAAHRWDNDHVVALAWQARAALSKAAPKGEESNHG
ncbi:hypothetical protein [uncultured Variovorax sp.]|uniref:hypothetical protein n=1 Tax=uncultured Variovorax sp. TaxID=114708 RepID=UPI0025F31477|nr:hypothetical protein [uncultured Variovorax sp.]